MKFSVIIPIFNKANTIVQALDSVCNQSIQDFEIIVVNDGSTDNVLDVLQKYPYPLKVISQRNMGVSVARNTGINNAEGEYICFLDADDMWYPNHLAVIMDMMSQNPDISYFGTCHRVSFQHGRIVNGNNRISNLEQIQLVDNLIGFINKYGGILNTNSICVKRSIFQDENIYFEPGEKLGEDVDVWYRIALKHPIAISNKMTTLYRREFSSATISTSNAPDWCFAKRQLAILNDCTIADNNKKSYITMCDRYYLTISRELSYNHNKNEALRRLKMIHYKLSIRFIISLAIYLIPCFILDMLPTRLKK